MNAEAPVVSRSIGVPVVVRASRRTGRREALRGVKIGLRSHSGFAVHIFTSALILAGAITLACDIWEWAILLGGLGALFAAELFHAVLCRLIPYADRMPEADRDRCAAMAAGGVLIVRITALGLALLIFSNHVAEMLALRNG